MVTTLMVFHTAVDLVIVQVVALMVVLVGKLDIQLCGLKNYKYRTRVDSLSTVILNATKAANNICDLRYCPSCPRKPFKSEKHGWICAILSPMWML